MCFYSINCFLKFQVGYFVGGVASLESGEIAGIAVTLSAIALVLLVLLLVFLVRQRHCSSMVLLFSGSGPRSSKTRQNVNGHLQIQQQQQQQQPPPQTTTMTGKATANGHSIHQNLKVRQTDLFLNNFFNI